MLAASISRGVLSARQLKHVIFRRVRTHDATQTILVAGSSSARRGHRPHDPCSKQSREDRRLDSIQHAVRRRGQQAHTIASTQDILNVWTAMRRTLLPRQCVKDVIFPVSYASSEWIAGPLPTRDPRRCGSPWLDNGLEMGVHLIFHLGFVCSALEFRS